MAPLLEPAHDSRGKQLLTSETVGRAARMFVPATLKDRDLEGRPVAATGSG